MSNADSTKLQYIFYNLHASEQKIIVDKFPYIYECMANKCVASATGNCDTLRIVDNTIQRLFRHQK